MGTWDVGPFDNDDAADFLGNLSDLQEPDLIVAALGDALLAVTAADGYIEAPEMSHAIAAAAIVAMFATPSLQASSTLDESWFRSVAVTPSDQLKAEASRALARAFEPDDNEWYELWDSAGLLENVRAKLTDVVNAVVTFDAPRDPAT